MFRSGSKQVTGEARTIDPNMNDGDTGGDDGSGSGHASPTNIIIISTFAFLAVCAVMVALVLRKRLEVAARSHRGNNDRVRASPSMDASILSAPTAPSNVEQPSAVPSKIKSVSFADSQPIPSLTSRIWGSTEYERHPFDIENLSFLEVESCTDGDGLETDDEYQTEAMIEKMEKIRAMQRYNEQLRQQISSNGSVISQVSSLGSQRRRQQEGLVHTVGLR
jgi:hypothetical protein